MWNVISKTHVYLVTPRGLGLNTGVRRLAAATDRVYARSTTLEVPLYVQVTSG